MYGINRDIKLYCLFGKSDSKRTYIINELLCKNVKVFLFSMELLDATQFQVFLSTAKQHFLSDGLPV